MILMLRKRLLCFLWMVCYLTSLQGYGQKRTFHCRKTEQIIEFIQQSHIQARSLDSSFTKQVNNKFVSILDPLGLFFTQEDVAFIHASCPELDNLQCQENKNFMEPILELYRERLIVSNSVALSILKDSLDFSEKDTLILPQEETITYPLEENGIWKNWNRYLRFQVLRHYVTVQVAEDSVGAGSPEHFFRHLDVLKEAIEQRENCKIDHILDYPGGFDEYIFGAYLNSLTGNFDPHTNYFSMQDKEQFESSLSRSKYSFGADLQQKENGEIAISRIVPGGPAWRSGELNPGDVLVNIRFPGKEPIDLFCSNLMEIQDLIYNSGADQVVVTLRTALGQVKSIELKMEEVAASENVVYSFVLNGAKKIGYISLPGFYTDPEQLDPLGCASDLAREIDLLQNDSVAGLILDLRNNGGGSIVEAVELAGILLDSGPLCIYRTNHEKPTLIKDLNRGALYTGPLVLLINGYSASASELLAMILQDHNRALIVGTPSFGKASGQIILPLADPGNDHPDQYFFGFEPTDYLKVTTTRYYRLNGTSPQATGIKPDVQLPVHAGFSKIKESAYKTALKNDTVRKDIRFDPLPSLPEKSLVEKSNDRMAYNSNFIAFNAFNDSIRPLYQEDFRIPLEIGAFYLDYKRNSAFFKSLDKLKAIPDNSYRIEEHTLNKERLRKDTYLKEVHDEIIKNLVRDFYLEETYQIMSDLIDYEDDKYSEAEW